MQPSPIESVSRQTTEILELTVRNHPGVMSHICGMFSRRAFNLDGILCMPVGDGTCSRMWLKTSNDERLQQVISQLLRLHDVLSVKRHGADHRVFVDIERFFRE
jgi:acetolactate synthase-1/3 small subunit